MSKYWSSNVMTWKYNVNWFVCCFSFHCSLRVPMKLNLFRILFFFVCFLKNAFCSVLFLSCVKSLVSIQSAIHVSTWILVSKRSRGFSRWFNRTFSHCPVVQGYLTLLSLQCYCCCFSFLLFLFTIAMWGSATDHNIAVYISQ